MSDIPSLKTWLPSVLRFEVGFIVKVVSFLQFAKALFLISVTESGNTKVTIGAPLKQSCPITITPSASSTLVSEEQPWNTPVLNANGPVKPSSKLTLVTLLPLNVYVLKSVQPAGITTVVIPLPANAFCPVICSSELGRVRFDAGTFWNAPPPIVFTCGVPA